MRRILIALSLAASLAVASPAFLDFLSSLWSETGSHIDPDGKPAPQNDEGSHLDPEADEGPELDPDG